MQAIYYKPPYCSFYQAINSSAYFSAPAPGLQNSAARIVATPQSRNTLILSGTTEHNTVDEKAGLMKSIFKADVLEESGRGEM